MKKFNTNENLLIVRIELKDKISDSIVFTVNGYEINKKDEEQFTLGLIEENGIIKLKQLKSIIKNIPIPGSILIKNQNGLKIYKYPKITFNNEEETKAITFMLIGEKGVGKTTLINSFINFILGIQFDVDFRYKIIIESNEQNINLNQDINIYNIASHGNYPPFKIIDTPGFDFTKGIKINLNINELIKEKLDNEIDKINAICFVEKSNISNLTLYQKYIFDNIIGLFGNDIFENFIFIMTYFDKSGIPLKDVLLESNFNSIIKLIKEPWYLKFNNSAFFEYDENNELIKFLWKLGMKSFEEFYKKLLSLTSKSTTLTKELLSNKNLLNTSVQQLKLEINLGLKKINNIKQLLIKIEKEKDINELNKNYIIDIDIPYITKIDLKKGEYQICCLTCNHACLYPCYYTEENKRNCPIFKKDYCTVCPYRCHFSLHNNVLFRLEVKTKKEKKIIEDIKKKYDDSKENIILYQKKKKNH